jgi:hypothetical protein
MMKLKSIENEHTIWMTESSNIIVIVRIRERNAKEKYNTEE